MSSKNFILLLILILTSRAYGTTVHQASGCKDKYEVQLESVEGEYFSSLGLPFQKLKLVVLKHLSGQARQQKFILDVVKAEMTKMEPFKKYFISLHGQNLCDLQLLD
jgi:hypothetical protein